MEYRHSSQVDADAPAVDEHMHEWSAKGWTLLTVTTQSWAERGVADITVHSHHVHHFFWERHGEDREPLRREPGGEHDGL
jgi:hypothetical protein